MKRAKRGSLLPAREARAKEEARITRLKAPKKGDSVYDVFTQRLETCGWGEFLKLLKSEHVEQPDIKVKDGSDTDMLEWFSAFYKVIMYSAKFEMDGKHDMAYCTRAMLLDAGTAVVASACFPDATMEYDKVGDMCRFHIQKLDDEHEASRKKKK